MPFCGGRRTALPLRIPVSLILELQNDLGCSRNDLKSIYERFRRLAPYGQLSLPKFQECLGLFGTLGKLLSESMFIAFDRDGDGFLDFVEFASAVLTMLHGSQERRLELSFRIVHTPGTVDGVRQRREGSGSVTASASEDACEDIGNCIDMENFKSLVNDITATKNVLMGRDTSHYTPEYIEHIFNTNASLCSDGVPRISQRDYDRAIQCSGDFLELLGAPSAHCAVEASMAQAANGMLTSSFQTRCLTKTGSEDALCKNRTYINRTNAHHPHRHHARSHGNSMTMNPRSLSSLSMISPSRRGLAVYFGHERWNDVINMMIGLGLSARRDSSGAVDSVSPEHFSERRVFSISPNMLFGVEPSLNFVEEGAAARHTFRDDPYRVVFTEYAPVVFKHLRGLMNLTEEEYIQSVGPEHLVGNMVLGNLSTLSALVSEGKSGALFYYTANGRLVLKTVTEKCAEFVQSWLPSYYEHSQSHPDSLITRFVGLFSMTQAKDRGVPTYFLVMNNVFYSSVAIHRRYDLKGSWVGRSVPSPERKDHTVALKDCDMEELGEFLELGDDRCFEFFAVLERDIEFLSRSQLLDYSLLLGIHYKSMSEDDVDWERNVESYQRCCLMGKDRDKLYFLGVIDVLTPWSFSKRAENAWRRIQTLNNPGVSCVNPQAYGQRLLNFIKKRTN